MNKDPEIWKTYEISMLIISKNRLKTPGYFIPNSSNYYKFYLNVFYIFLNLKFHFYIFIFP